MSKLVDIETIRKQVEQWMPDNPNGDEHLNGERVAFRSVLHLLDELDTLPEEKPFDVENAIVDYYGRMPEDTDKVNAALHFLAVGRANSKIVSEEKPINIITELENLLEANGMYIDDDWKVRCNNGDSTDNRWQYELVARHFYSIRQGGHKNEKEKPVDLEKEIKEYWEEHQYDHRFIRQVEDGFGKGMIRNAARHFFNLGRMAKKD